METPEQMALREYRAIRRKFASEFKAYYRGGRFHVVNLLWNQKSLYSLEGLRAETKRLQAEYAKYQEEAQP